MVSSMQHKLLYQPAYILFTKVSEVVNTTTVYAEAYHLQYISSSIVFRHCYADHSYQNEDFYNKFILNFSTVMPCSHHQHRLDKTVFPCRWCELGIRQIVHVRSQLLAVHVGCKHHGITEKM